MCNYIMWKSETSPWILVEVLNKSDLQSVEKELLEKNYVIHIVEESNSFYYLHVSKEDEF